MVTQAMIVSLQLNAREVLQWQTIDCIMMQKLASNKLWRLLTGLLSLFHHSHEQMISVGGKW